MSRKPITIAVLMVLCALLLVAAGCGSKKKTTSTTTAAVATSAPPVAATTAAASTTTASGGSGGGSSDCKSFENAAAQIGKDMQSVTATGGNQAAEIKKASTALNDLANEAPSAIKPDFQTISNYFKDAAAAFNGGTPDVSKLQALSADAPKITAASTHISTWVSQNCH